MKKSKYQKRYTIALANGEKVTADAGTLNEIACMCFEASEHYALLGCQALAELSAKHADAIHAQLAERKFYED